MSVIEFCTQSMQGLTDYESRHQLAASLLSLMCKLERNPEYDCLSSWGLISKRCQMDRANNRCRQACWESSLLLPPSDLLNEKQTLQTTLLNIELTLSLPAIINIVIDIIVIRDAIFASEKAICVASGMIKSTSLFSKHFSECTPGKVVKNSQSLFLLSSFTSTERREFDAMQKGKFSGTRKINICSEMKSNEMLVESFM